MSTTIFNRTEEIEILERLFKSTRPEFLAIYGEQDVEKTHLIHEFFKNKSVYFRLAGKETGLENFSRNLQNIFPDLSEPKEPGDWDEALYLLKEAVSKIDSSKRVVIFFDGLPWLASSKSDFLPALEYMWNQHFSRMNNLLLIVCGSSSAIEKIINNHRGLYGRLSEVIKLNAFTNMPVS